MCMIGKPEIRIELEGRSSIVRLHPPAFDEIGALTVDPKELTDDQRRVTLRLSLTTHVESIDGEPMRLKMADRVMSDASALAAVTAARNAYYESARATGTVHARCPRCPEGCVPISIFEHAARIGATVPSLVADDPAYLLPPALADRHRNAVRADGLAMASGFDFVLPSTRTGVLARSTVSKSLRERWAPEDVEQPDDRVWWRDGQPCFEALLALAYAVAKLGKGKPTPVGLSKLAAADIYFLDALYCVVHGGVITERTAPETCPSCGANFFAAA